MNDKRVHFMYLVPSDKDAVATDAIERAALHLRAWYQWRLGGKTFTLSDPIVQVVRTEHASNWYPENPTPSEQRFWFIDNVRNDAAAAGATIFDGVNDYMVYCDAQRHAAQALGGMIGLAIFCSDDVLGLLDQNPDRTLCRQIGGDGHELGHTFGLHHPDIHDPQYGTALMGTGYISYPASILTDVDKATLNANPFLALEPHATPPQGLCPFRQRPVHRPRPTRSQ